LESFPKPNDGRGRKTVEVAKVDDKKPAKKKAKKTAKRKTKAKA
jgi:hypothetical protein